MFQLDENFLQQVGLSDLPEDQKKMFLEYFREQLQLRVGMRLTEGLSDEQLAEFEAFIERKDDIVSTWLANNAPNYEQDQIYQRLKSGAPENISHNIVLAEYASLKWLGLNRPDYKDVVTQTMNELRNEVIANREAILGSDPEAAAPTA